MPYNHAGEIGDVWKHLPLCDILFIENPIRYHETNSAYSGYTIAKNPNTEYGIFKLLSKPDGIVYDSKYINVLYKNGIDKMHYTGSPGLAMEILSNRANYFFHDIEIDALKDVEEYANTKGLQNNVQTFCGDSIKRFLSDDYKLKEDDFVFLDPYSPFDKNEDGKNFFDVFEKVIIHKSKALLWYGYDTLQNKREISEHLSQLAKNHNVSIWSFDLWQKSMTENECTINPGVPGCGLACAYLSENSVEILKKYLQIIAQYYSNETYCNCAKLRMKKATGSMVRNYDHQNCE